MSKTRDNLQIAATSAVIALGLTINVKQSFEEYAGCLAVKSEAPETVCEPDYAVKSLLRGVVDFDKL